MAGNKPHIAILTGNKTFAEIYLIRRIRQSFSDVCVIAPSTTKLSTKQFWTRIKATVRYKMHLLPLYLRYGYNYGLTENWFPTHKIDLYTQDINAPEVADCLENFRPDILCIFGTKKVEDDILSKAKICLNIHNGFVPYYKGVSSSTWVSYHQNYPYLYFCIHEAISKLDAGRIFCMEPVVPYFFETLDQYNRRRSLTAVKKMVDVVRSIETYAEQATPQPKHKYARNFRHKDKPEHMQKIANENFVSNNAKRYLAKQPRTNNREKKAVQTFLAQNTPQQLSNGWYIASYHEIIQSDNLQSYPVPNIYTHHENFLKHLSFYQKEFKIIPLSEGIRRFEEDSLKDDRYLSITFDDGLKSVASILPILKQANICPTLFVNTNPLLYQKPLENHRLLFLYQYLIQSEHTDASYQNRTYSELYQTLGESFVRFVQSRYLTQEDLLQAITDQQIEIGSHTRSHINLNTHDYAVLQQEIQEAHEQLESALQSKISYFSFPFGKLDTLNFKSEYLAMQTARFYFGCFGGINQNKMPGMVLRFGIHDEKPSELEHLFLSQYVR